jgi:hypothetical protein
MPVVSKKLDTTARIFVKKCFIKDNNTVELLKGWYKMNTLHLNFVGKVIPHV